jgi:hypothetical protein
MGDKTGKAFGHRSAKVKGDLFQTHYSLTWELLKRESFHCGIHEPCCGKMAIVNALGNHSKATYSDLYYGNKIQNYLEDKTIYDNIITNPPYGKMTDDIILHAKKHTKFKIAMLLRTNYLSGYLRYRKDVYKELRTVYVFTRMPDLRAPIREDGKYPTAMIVYGWFIWEKDYAGLPNLEWIDNQKYVLRKGE